MSDKQLRIIGAEAQEDKKAEGCGEILAELAKVEAQLVSGEVEGIIVVVREASGEAYPLVYGMGDLASVIGHLELVKASITLSAFAGDDD